MAKLPLVSSTYGMVSDLYSNTKDNHPTFKSVCEAAEMGVKTLTSVAFTSALPIIGKLEPQSKHHLNIGPVYTLYLHRTSFLRFFFVLFSLSG